MGSEQCQTHTDRWRPLLEGQDTTRVREVTQAIADALPGRSSAPLPEGAAEQSALDASLAGGQAGLALCFAYLARARSDEKAAERAWRFLDQAIDATARVQMDASLYAGFPGVAWAAAHLGLDRPIPDEEDPHEAVDEALRDYVGQSPWRRDYDLVRGLVGAGVYALERLPSPLAVECLERIVDRLDETVERTAEGVTWLTRPELLPPHQRQTCPHGYYNLGVAHGVPGVIALLANLCAANVAKAQARPLLNGAVAWLLAQRLPEDAGGGFPAWVGPDIPRTPTRSGWCYGDPGIAATLLLAARCVGEPTWEQEALEIARRAASRSPEKAGVRDAGLCHGAAGLGHLYNRMFQVTGATFLADAARSWFERALELRRPEVGIAGFSTWTVYPGREPAWVDEPGILSGAAGIALALLAAVTSTEPAWDRMLLLSGGADRSTSGHDHGRSE